MMFFHCRRLLLVLGLVVAQDLFQKENKFLPQRGLTIQTVNPNETSLTAQVAVSSTDSWWKTITPEENHMLCLDAPGGNAFNGNMLWLWECNGMDSQIWVFDNYQIRYSGDESYCIDARDMSNGVQLMLWECNGSDQQTWGYDFSAMRVYISGSSTCFDFWEDQQWNGQYMHVWECNGLGNQEWGLWDSGAPSGPAPSPSSNFYPPHCGNNPDGWPVFNSASDLQNDNWGRYFQEVYGEIPQTGYPICISAFQYLVDYAVSNAGIGISPSQGCPSNTGDYYKTMARAGLQSSGSSWIWNPNVFSAIPGDLWVEVIHEAFKMDISSSWMYYAAGSAIWFWTGNTVSYQDHEDAVKDMMGHGCQEFQCMNEFSTLFPLAASQGYASIQFLTHYDMQCGMSGGGQYKCGAIEIVDVNGNGKSNCASSYRAGWEASQDCNCQSGHYAMCAGFGDQSGR